MANALDVARQLIHLAAAEEEPDYLTNLRLQKLLYYVQGWSLALREDPMYDDRIEAWALGPVVVSVYPQFAKYGNKPIPPEEVPAPSKLTTDEKSFIKSVWDSYKVYSANSLLEMTHKEAPWLNTRQGYSPADNCQEEITRSALKEYFTKLAG